MTKHSKRTKRLRRRHRSRPLSKNAKQGNPKRLVARAALWITIAGAIGVAVVLATMFSVGPDVVPPATPDPREALRFPFSVQNNADAFNFYDVVVGCSFSKATLVRGGRHLRMEDSQIDSADIQQLGTITPHHAAPAECIVGPGDTVEEFSPPFAIIVHWRFLNIIPRTQYYCFDLRPDSRGTQVWIPAACARRPTQSP